MRLLQLLSLAALILLGEAAVGSVPDIVAAREGGMGLGSALLMAQLAQVAGVAFGAIVAASLVERWSMGVALVAGALVYYAGLIGVGHQPAHLLGWVIVILAIAGAGLGMMLTAAFTAAAETRPSQRPFTLAALLLAAVVAGPLAGIALFSAGPPALVLVAAIIVGGAVLVARSIGGLSALEPVSARRTRGSRHLAGRRGLAGGGLLALGVLAALWGIDPSRVSAALLAATFGVAGLDVLDGLRLGLVLVGLVAVAGGLVLLNTRWQPSGATVLAAAASLAAALAVAGLVAVAGFAMPRDLSLPDSRGGPLGELSAVAGGVAGVALGAWLLARGTRPRPLVLGGSLLLALLAVGAVLGAGSVLRTSGAVGPLGGIAAAALAGGITAVGLRLILAEAPSGERGIAAGAGVAAASVGAITGLMIGAAEGVGFAIGTAGDVPIGSLILLAAALVTLGLAVVLPQGRAIEDAGRPEGVAAA